MVLARLLWGLTYFLGVGWLAFSLVSFRIIMPSSSSSSSSSQEQSSRQIPLLVRDALRQLVELGHMHAKDVQGFAARLVTLPPITAVELLFSCGGSRGGSAPAAPLATLDQDSCARMDDLGRRCARCSGTWLQWAEARSESCHPLHPESFFLHDWLPMTLGSITNP